MTQETPLKNAVKPIRNAHDKSYRNAMRHPLVARDMLSHHLPEEIKKQINLDTLKIEDGTFIDPQLQESSADIVYSVEWREEKPSEKLPPIFIYALFEQQRNPELFMPFRIIKYTCSLIDKHLSQHSDKVLPIVIPVVIFNGDKPYPYPLKIFDLFGDKKTLAEKFMFNQFHLIDLNIISDEELRQHQWSGLMEMLLKNIARRDMMQYIQGLTEDFNRLLAAGLQSYVLTMLKYIIEKAEIEDKAQFFNWVHQNLTSTPMENETMTIAEQLRAEGYDSGVLAGRQQGIAQGMEQGLRQGLQQGVERGIQQGVERGIQQGVEQGTLQGERTLLIRLVTRRFGAVPNDYLQKIEQANANTLLLWGEKILDAKSLDELFESYH